MENIFNLSLKAFDEQVRLYNSKEQYQNETAKVYLELLIRAYKGKDDKNHKKSCQFTQADIEKILSKVSHKAQKDARSTRGTIKATLEATKAIKAVGVVSSKKTGMTHTLLELVVLSFNPIFKSKYNSTSPLKKFMNSVQSLKADFLTGKYDKVPQAERIEFIKKLDEVVIKYYELPEPKLTKPMGINEVEMLKLSSVKIKLANGMIKNPVFILNQAKKFLKLNGALPANMFVPRKGKLSSLNSK
jgi:hypothetical protein